MMNSERKPLRIAFVFAHPDDEHIPFGLPAQLVENGNDVHLISLTKGDLGSHTIASRRKIARIRKREFEQSARHLGVQHSHILGLPDGEIITNTSKAHKRLLAMLRHIDPDVIITQPNDYHQDHTQAGEITQWAAFHLQDAPITTRGGLFRRRIFPTVKEVTVYEMDTQGSQTWQSLTADTGKNFDHLFSVNTILEIGRSAIEKSVNAFLSHRSQLTGPTDYVALAVKGAQRRGQQAQFPYAAGLNLISFGGYAFSTKNLLANQFGTLHTKTFS